MKYLIALIIAAIPWYPIGWAIFELTGEEEVALVTTSIISIIIFFFSLSKLNINKNDTTLASKTISKVKDFKDNIEYDLDEKNAAFYAQAEEEYENGEIDKGLWSQALIKAKGDENLRKVEYMKLRAKQLKKNTKAS